MSQGKLLIGRLVVLIQIIALPLYFIGIFWTILPDPDINLITNPIYELIIAKILAPIFLLFPWFIFSIVHRYRLADTYSYAGETIIRMPTVMRIFYTLNFVLALCFFVLPILSPVLAIFSGWFLYGLLTNESQGELNEKTIPKPRILVTLLLMPIPLLIALSYRTYIGSLISYLNNYWISHLDQIYTSGVNLAAAAAIGGFLYLVYEGAQQIDRYVKIPLKLITLISLAIFVTAEALFIQTGWQTSIGLQVFHILGLGVGLVTFVIRAVRGLRQQSTSETSLTTLALVLPFILLEILRRNNLEKSFLVVLNAFLFLLVLLQSWRAAERPRY